MNSRQRRFAEEYSIDHNASAAAIRAGYEARRAKQTGYRLMQKVEVRQLIAKLDAKKRANLGIEAQDAVLRLHELFDQASELQPKLWKGEPVTYVDADGQVVPITEFRSAAAAAGALEMMVALAGLDKPRSGNVPLDTVVSYTMALDPDLRRDGEDDQPPKPGTPG